MGCWAMRESKSDPNTCTFDWIMCLDLKGRFPRFVLDKVSKKDQFPIPCNNLNLN